MTVAPTVSDEFVQLHVRGDLFGTSVPSEIHAIAVSIAGVVQAFVREHNLFVELDREHVNVEGWTFCAALAGVHPVCVWTKPMQGNSGWEARVEARTAAGTLVGAGESHCQRLEPRWATRDGFTLRSMAQTRATAKALRMPLGFVMVLAGFNPTPAEEVEGSEPFDHSQRQQPRSERRQDPKRKPFPNWKQLFAALDELVADEATTTREWFLVALHAEHDIEFSTFKALGEIDNGDVEADVFQRIHRVYWRLCDDHGGVGSMPPPSESVRKAWFHEFPKLTCDAAGGVAGGASDGGHPDEPAWTIDQTKRALLFTRMTEAGFKKPQLAEIVEQVTGSKSTESIASQEQFQAIVDELDRRIAERLENDHPDAAAEAAANGGHA